MPRLRTLLIVFSGYLQLRAGSKVAEVGALAAARKKSRNFIL